jgi:chemotaxis protein methyltransferase WspC
VIPEIRNRVRILKGNILDDRLLADADPYHVIFCRNLLIYLTPEAQRIAVENLDRLLAINGLLFVGHVERKPAGIVDYDWIRKPGVFACRKTHRKEKASQTPPSPAKPVSGQKITLRPPVPLNAAVVSQSVQNDPPQSAPATQPAPAQTTPGDPLERAQQMADRGRMEDALKICQQCVSENAFHSPAHFLMGLIHHAMDEEERAEGCFNKAVYLDPNHEEALTYLAFIAEHRGDRDKAVHLRQWAQRIRDRKGKTA